MLENIAPGARVNVRITQRPSNEAAVKTLRRVLSKDPVFHQENRRQEKVRKSGFRTKQRGGRPWEVRLVKQHAVNAEVGEQGTVVATVDVLRDLQSVGRFVEVSPA